MHDYSKPDIDYDFVYDFVETMTDKKQLKQLWSICDYKLSDTYAQKITCSDDIASRLSWMKYEEQENFVCVTLDNATEIIGMHKITIGLLNQCPVHPREAFKKAIQDNASCIIFAHNHPSGRTEPSKEDIALTRMLTSCGKILMIPVLDHIIIGRKERQFSFANGYPELFENQKFNIK